MAYIWLIRAHDAGGFHIREYVHIGCVVGHTGWQCGHSNTWS
jgi:hypothetical protein